MGWPKGKPRPPGAGRQKGSPNKASKTREAIIAAAGITPLEYMFQVLKNPASTPVERQWAAQNAAPYVHPRLAHASLTHEVGDSLVDILNAIGKRSSKP